MKLPKLALHWKILIGILLGVISGILLKDYVHYVEWIGTIFLRGLTMIVVPLVFSSIFMGVAGMEKSSNLGRIGGKAVAFYLGSTFIATMVALTMVKLINPGQNSSIALPETATEITRTNITLVQQIINIVPDNIFKEMASGNLLSLIFFAILMGFFTTRLDEKFQKPLKDLFSSIFEVMMKITMFVLKFTPYGVFAIVANMIAKQAGNSENMASLAGSLGLFVVTVWLSCLIQGLIVLPGLVKLLGRESPWRLIRKMSTPLLTAFTTCSSGAALPLSIKYSQEKLGVSKQIAGFTLPLGNTLNMNGTAVFECVAALFIAQIYGVELSLSQQILIIITSLLAAAGSAGIPMAAMVMMAIVLNVAGLPLEGIGLIMAVNQICDMPRTCLNVYGDICGAVVIAKSEGEKLTI